MRIFKTKVFNKWAKGLLTDVNLIDAAYEIAEGNLGEIIYRTQRLWTESP